MCSDKFSETLGQHTDRTDKSPSVSSVRSSPEGFPSNSRWLDRLRCLETDSSVEFTPGHELSASATCLEAKALDEIPELDVTLKDFAVSGASLLVDSSLLGERVTFAADSAPGVPRGIVNYRIKILVIPPNSGGKYFAHTTVPLWHTKKYNNISQM